MNNFKVVKKIIKYKVKSIEDCLAEIEILKAENQSWIMDLNNGARVEGPAENCKNGQTKSSSLDDIFNTWLQTMVTAYGADQGYKILLQSPELPFEEEQNSELVLSNLKLTNADSFILEASVWGTTKKPSMLKLAKGQLDTNGLPHGQCILEVHTEPDGHYLLNWKPIKIKGRFVHGKLEGIARITLVQNSLLWATFHQGVLHGPAFAFGLYPVYEVIL